MNTQEQTYQVTRAAAIAQSTTTQACTGLTALNEAFKTIDSMHREFKDGALTTYAIRCALGRNSVREKEDTLAKFLKAFTLPKDTYDSRCKAVGGHIGIEKAAWQMVKLRQDLYFLKKRNGLNPENALTAQCVSQVCGNGLGINRWIGVMDALGYNLDEINNASDLLVKVSLQFDEIHAQVEKLVKQEFLD